MYTILIKTSKICTTDTTTGVRSLRPISFEQMVSGCTMALGSTRPLTEMSTRNIYCGGKGGRCVGLTNLPPSCADCIEI